LLEVEIEYGRDQFGKSWKMAESKEVGLLISIKRGISKAIYLALHNRPFCPASGLHPTLNYHFQQWQPGNRCNDSFKKKTKQYLKRIPAALLW
jgi:hypothetical protein